MHRSQYILLGKSVTKKGEGHLEVDRDGHRDSSHLPNPSSSFAQIVQAPMFDGTIQQTIRSQTSECGFKPHMRNSTCQSSADATRQTQRTPHRPKSIALYFTYNPRQHKLPYLLSYKICQLCGTCPLLSSSILRSEAGPS
jgi:hypothetical protein